MEKPAPEGHRHDGGAMSTTPHDDLMRHILSHPEHAAGELQHLLPPEVSARVDWSTLELVPGNFVDESLQGSYSDLLFRVQVGAAPADLYLIAGMAGWAELFRAVRRAPNGAVAMAAVWRYLLSVHEAIEERVLPALTAALDEEQRQDMATIAEQLIEKGERKGMEKGQRAIVQRLLERRFGPLPPEALARLARAVPSELEQWAERLLVAATLSEVLEATP